MIWKNIPIYPLPRRSNLVGQIAVVFIFGMGLSNDALGSFVPSMLVLVGLIVVGCILLALIKESPMMTTRRKAPIEPASEPAA